MSRTPRFFTQEQIKNQKNRIKLAIASGLIAVTHTDKIDNALKQLDLIIKTAMK
ncbi:hypothetical protein [Acinetobacter rudis]|uniref:Uncharacterized protein n=1 Tax=Acinetobacter rudis TaxID=632955 RepID=A0AAW8J4L0_9GAMM|nr:hypothetical protein [Acinetobacter rudis]MDQ8934303.1 hypothetical protein [Acinetobacter rudis]MDQ9016389.1 hypothetical protein [Acinetobacter rudis]